MSLNIKKPLEVDYLAARIISSRDYETNVDASAGYVLTAGSNGRAYWGQNIATSVFGSIILPDISYSTISALNPSSLYEFQLQVSDPLTIDVLSSLNRITIGGNFSNFISSSALTSTVAGLGQIYLSSGGGLANDALTSTVAGLGKIYVSTPSLTSTVAGLGQKYVSTESLTSTTKGLTDYISSFIDPTELASTVVGLGTAQYVSSTWLGSTVAGLGQIYVSSIVQGTNISITGTAPNQVVNLKTEISGLNSISLQNNGYITFTGAGNLTFQDPDPNNNTINMGFGDIDNVRNVNIGFMGESGAVVFDVCGGQIIFNSLGNSDNIIYMGEGHIQDVSTIYVKNTHIRDGGKISFDGYNTYIDMNNGIIKNVSTTWTSTLYADTINYNTLNPPINIIIPLTSTVAGLGQTYVSTPSLTSTVAGLGCIYISSIPSDLVSTPNLTSSVAGLGQTYVSTQSLTSTVQGLGKIYISTIPSDLVSTPSLTSTVAGLGQIYVSTDSLASTVAGLGQIYKSSIDVSGSINSALTSTVAGLGQTYVSTQSLTSTVAGLGRIYISTIPSDLVSTPSLTSTVAGLGRIYISTIPSDLVSTPSLTSTVAGLGKIYISSIPSDLVSTPSLTSTVAGLGRIYISSIPLDLVSTPSLTSTVAGLGQTYVSTQSLTSTVAGLEVFYLTTPSLTSTVAGLGQTYVSNQTLDYKLINLGSIFGPKNSYVSVATLSSAMDKVKDDIIGGATGTWLTLVQISTALGETSSVTAALFSSINDIKKGLSSVADIMQAQINDVSGSLNTQIYDLSNSVYTNFVQYPYFNTNLASTVAGLGRIYVSTDSLTSTVAGLGRIYVSTDSLTSTVAGLGQKYISSIPIDLVSTPNLTSTVAGLGQIYVSTQSLTSTVAGLGQIYVSIQSLTSTVSELQNAANIAALTSTVAGLGQIYTSTQSLTSTVANLGQIYVSTQSLTSTVAGLGQKYISSIPIDLVSTPNLASTVANLGQIYTSTQSLTSTVANLGQIYTSTQSLTSTVANLGRFYVSTQSLTSTVANLGQIYTSTQSLTSTVAGLGNIYLSTGLTNTTLVSTVAGLGTAGYASTSGITANYYTYVTAATGGPISGTSNLQVTVANSIQHPQLNAWVEDIETEIDVSGTSRTFNCSLLYNNYRYVFNNSLGNSALTIQLGANIANIPNGKVFGANFFIRQTNSYSGNTVTFANSAGSIRWPGGTAPTYTSALNKMDIYNLITYDQGANWYGFVAGKNYPIA